MGKVIMKGCENKNICQYWLFLVDKNVVEH